MKERPPDAEGAAAGLCHDCRWVRRVTSGKGSCFFYCRLSETDETFARYPRLPVLACRGYERDPHGR